MRRLALALLVLTLSPPAGAQEDLLDQIYGRFSHVTGASADFTEVKKIKAFKKDQVQKGKFSSSREGELTWEIIEPVRSTFTVKGDTARVTYPDKGYEKTYDLEKDKGIGTVVKNIFAVVGATGSASLKEAYACAVEGSWKEGWTVTLVPKNKKVKKVIKKIILTITKKDFITSIRIFEGDGDSTTITFTNIKLKKK
jgi:outer membrane lipoprotein-sorting protein